MKLDVGPFAHRFFIEILNKQWRILSQWDTKHTFLEYAENGKYGKLTSDTDEFYGDLEILYRKRKGEDARKVRADHIKMRDILRKIFMDAYETEHPIKDYPDEYFTNTWQISVIPKIYVTNVQKIE
jgi:hypothetical protein